MNRNQNYANLNFWKCFLICIQSEEPYRGRDKHTVKYEAVFYFISSLDINMTKYVARMNLCFVPFELKFSLS